MNVPCHAITMSYHYIQERKQLEEEQARKEMQMDYLAPFLAQVGDPEIMTRELSVKIRDNCLHDLKQRLIDIANVIQSRFEKVCISCVHFLGVDIVRNFSSCQQETQELQRQQAWYQQNQTTLNKEQEEDYLSFCSEAMFRIHILEERLNRYSLVLSYTCA